MVFPVPPYQLFQIPYVYRNLSLLKSKISKIIEAHFHDPIFMFYTVHKILLSTFRIAVLCTQKMPSSVFSRLCGFSFVYAPVKNRFFLNINVH